MPTYAVTYTYTDDTAQRDAVRADHRTYLSGLADDGVVRASGPLAPVAGVPDGALLIFEAASRDALDALVDADPFVEAGLVAGRDVREWNVVIGGFAS
ncbi:YciI family protein [Antribacter gilvus]|uniref:YciI family protein n=1 Tax=Antribacter gilvus TaxID=2304675 RepID=UPI000F781A46|nr:YciI family protein [Antribacter gilvus]